MYVCLCMCVCVYVCKTPKIRYVISILFVGVDLPRHLESNSINVKFTKFLPPHSFICKNLLLSEGKGFAKLKKGTKTLKP